MKKMIVANRSRRFGQPNGELKKYVSWAMADEAWREITSWDGYAATPLIEWSGLAKAIGVASIHCKYEGGRFNIGSFKALGGAYAALRALNTHLDKACPNGNGALQPQDVTICTASDGNHGLSVAWGARRAGSKCVVFLHAGVSRSRQELIEAMGAEVRRVDGNYDVSTAQALSVSKAEGWILVADTAPEYSENPVRVMSGYGVMVRETLDQYGDVAPTHIFLQGGCGGLAAGVVGLLRERDNSSTSPCVVVVEPDRADCLFKSAEEGRPIRVDGDLDTLMSGLSVGEVSCVAWPVLEHGVDFFMRIPDEAALKAMQAFASGFAGDASIEIGDSGVAGIAGALIAVRDTDVSRMLGLGHDSRILVIATEGAVDRDSYEKLVARTDADFRFGIAGQ